MENYDGARSRLRDISLRFVCHRTIVLQIHVKNTDMLRVSRLGKLENEVSCICILYSPLSIFPFLFFLHRFLFLLSFLCFSFFPFFFSFACISSLSSFFSYLCLSSLSPTLVPFFLNALSPSFSSFISPLSLASLFSFFPCLHHFLPSLFSYFPFLSTSFVSPLPSLLFLSLLISLFYHFPAHPRIFFQVRGEIFHIVKVYEV